MEKIKELAKLFSQYKINYIGHYIHKGFLYFVDPSTAELYGDLFKAKYKGIAIKLYSELASNRYFCPATLSFLNTFPLISISQKLKP